jgi:hypothetical protein
MMKDELMQTMRRSKAKCTNPDIGRRVYIQIRAGAPNQEHVVLSSELEGHVKNCPHCSELVPLWIIKADGGLAAAAKNFLREAREGSPAIVHKHDGSTDIYFKHKVPGSDIGLMVKVREGSIASADEVIVDQFNYLTSNPR